MSEDVIFTNSRFTRDGEFFFAARLEGMDCIVTFFRPEAKPGARAALKGAEATLVVDGKEVGVKISPATYENVLALDRQVAPQRKLVALNKAGIKSGLGTGNRVVITWEDVPKLRHPGALGVFEGIFEAVREAGAPNWFVQQSIVRELIPEGADPKKHPGIGHTGGYGPRELLRSGLLRPRWLFAIREPRFAIRGRRRPRHRHRRERGGAGGIARPQQAGHRRGPRLHQVHCGHVPPVWLSGGTGRGGAGQAARRLPRPNLRGAQHPPRQARLHLPVRRGGNRPPGPQILARPPGAYDFVAGLKGDEPFDYELSLDETEEPTEPRELLFYLVALEEVMGLPRGAVASVAPNFGFRKRSDYEGDLERLKALVNECASIAAAFDAVVCFHSGSGKGVETGKGPGVDEVLREATGGRLELKVSGILQEILWRVLAESDVPEERALFEEAWDGTRRVVEALSTVHDRLIAGRTEREAMARLADEALVAEVAGEEGVRLVKGVLGYGLGMAKLAKELLATADPSRKRPADDFFRYFAYLVFRPLREKIYRTMTEATWRRYAEEVARYLRMRIEGLGLGQKA